MQGMTHHVCNAVHMIIRDAISAYKTAHKASHEADSCYHMTTQSAVSRASRHGMQGCRARVFFSRGVGGGGGWGAEGLHGCMPPE